MWRNTRRAALACVLALCAGLTGTFVARAGDFPSELAGRCKGEAAWALGACACVARNRLAAVQSETAVLAAVYAAPVEATPAEVRRVGAVLAGGFPCDPVWFMWSDTDVARLGLNEADALIRLERGGWVVLFYARDALDV
jgi:hypothetical protein